MPTYKQDRHLRSERTTLTPRIVRTFTVQLTSTTPVSAHVLVHGSDFYSVPAVIRGSGAAIVVADVLDSLSLSDPDESLEASFASAQRILDDIIERCVTSWGPTVRPADYDLAVAYAALDEVEPATTDLVNLFVEPLCTQTIN